MAQGVDVGESETVARHADNIDGNGFFRQWVVFPDAHLIAEVTQLRSVGREFAAKGYDAPGADEGGRR